jgi:serpin B
MKSIRDKSILLVAVLTLAACQPDNSVSPIQNELRSLSELEKQLVAADNTFAIKLFKEVAETEADSNICISPLSVSLAFGMALNGASGRTYEDMRATLELHGLTEQQINESFRNLMDLLVQIDPDVLLEIANSIWVRQGYPVLQDFLDVNRTYFDAAAYELDFSLPEAVDIINGWIADNTHDRIEDALDRIDPQVIMYLINTVYFKGLWTYQFAEENTVEAVFHNFDGSLTPCHMMQLEAELSYFETDDFQALDLPYGNQKYSMTILLPKGQISVDDIIAQITPETWAQWIASFDTQLVRVSLPRFTMEYDILLNDMLISLGMGIAFSGAADFSRITAGGGLYISRVIHNTFVEVNEEGTEAAAVTIIEIREVAMGSAVTVNRPFLFVIRESHSGSLLFMGKVIQLPEE